MEPSKKAPEINALLSLMAGKGRQSTIKGDNCMTCDGKAIDFKDDLSRREYAISGMCQKCQDGFFK